MKIFEETFAKYRQESYFCINSIENCYLMRDVSQIVNDLENKISRLLHKYEVLSKTHLELNRELMVSRSTIEEKDSIIRDWEEKYKALQLANSMLGSSETKTEAKLKINTLIRDIDYCIAQLSE